MSIFHSQQVIQYVRRSLIPVFLVVIQKAQKMLVGDGGKLRESKLRLLRGATERTTTTSDGGSGMRTWLKSHVTVFILLVTGSFRSLYLR